MSYTAEDVAALKRAAARGARKLKLANGEEVEFESLAALRRQIKEMEAEVAGGSSGAMSVSYPLTTRGL